MKPFYELILMPQKWEMYHVSLQTSIHFAEMTSLSFVTGFINHSCDPNLETQIVRTSYFLSQVLTTLLLVVFFLARSESIPLFLLQPSFPTGRLQKEKVVCFP